MIDSYVVQLSSSNNTARGQSFMLSIASCSSNEIRKVT